MSSTTTTTRERAIIAVLEEEGYNVRSSNNGREALEMLADPGSPDLVLLDLMMPVMSGWEVLQEMAKVPRLAALPVVVFTAAGNPLSGDLPISKPSSSESRSTSTCSSRWWRSSARRRTCPEEPPSDLLPRPTGTGTGAERIGRGCGGGRRPGEGPRE